MKHLWRQLAIATNWPVLVAVAVLCALGTMTIWADAGRGAGADFKKHIIYLCVGVACMAAFQGMNYQKIGRFAMAFYILSLALILYTVIGAKMVERGVPVPGIREVNGAYAWIFFGPASLQPAELMKIAFIMVLARYLRFRSNYRTILGLLAPFALAMVPLALILKQPDLGTALIFIPALFAMLFVAGAKIKHLLTIVGMGVALLPLVWFSGTDLPVFKYTPQLVRGYQRERVYAMFRTDPHTLQGKGYQQRNALIAYGSGGVSGKGVGVIPIGKSVPEGHNDMIFALLGEQLGFFGSAVVLAAYLVLFAAGIETSASTREPFGRLLAVGVVALLAGQTFINLLVAVRLMPVTGVTLPFISYGGSSLLASFMAAGLLLNIGQNRPVVMARDAFEFAGA